MRQYILHRTFVTHDGSCYQQRSKPYYESELPVLALSATFATLVDDGTVAEVIPQPIERNVIESHYNPTPDKNVIEQHYQPSYAQLEPPAEVQPVVVDLSALNSPDHVVESKSVVLGTATVDEIAALPYVSRKTAEKLVQALADGKTFSSMAELDCFNKLGFGKTFKDTGLLLPTVEAE